MSGSEAISPTAHYTGYVWFRNGLSHPALATRQGRLLFESLQPTIRVSRLLGGPTLEAYLLARPRAIGTLGANHRVVELDALRDDVGACICISRPRPRASRRSSARASRARGSGEPRPSRAATV